MGIYIIKRTDQGGGYVSKPGSAKSYTHKLQDARAWPSREAAQRECCENERVVRVNDEMNA